MRSRVLVALLFCTVLLVPVLRAQAPEPQVYFFWSASCPYSKAARTFLAGAQPRTRSCAFAISRS
ncbi:MAG TPA: hypothetical protein VFY92_13020, partial [Hyphomicrobiaceae bacterium]|nr:hypothetical protein [Hyphomicrobiaceae bacterium]